MLYASINERCKLIRKIAVTDADVTDTAVFEELLGLDNTSRDIYADRGYAKIECEARPKQAGRRLHIRRRDYATKGNSETQNRLNRAITML